MVTLVAPAAGLHTPPAEPVAGVSIGVGECLRSSVLTASPEVVIPPLLKLAGDVGDRLDDATWIGRVSPGFSLTTDTVLARPGWAGAAGASVGPPAVEGEPHFSLRSRRPYRPALTHTRAVRTLTHDCPGRFDPTLLAAFLTAASRIEQIFNEYPV